ncbi:retrovirus-related pol polyprotein from transposon TNT 1-94 [Tanacetum coccineum]
MQEELNEFKRLEVWELVPRPNKVMVITLKWIYKVKLYELGGTLKNKARLVARGYRQEEGIDFVDPLPPVSRLVLFDFPCICCPHMNMSLPMDVKTGLFLNGILREEVYASQPDGFVDQDNLNHVYKLKKSLYGLKQAPRACHGLEAATVWKTCKYRIQKNCSLDWVSQTASSLLVIGASQSRQQVDTSLIHIESRKSPTKRCLMLAQEGFIFM